MRTIEELRARLGEVSTDDLDAVHDLYLGMKEIQGHSNHARHNLEASVLARRIDRAMAQAIRSAQRRGEVTDVGLRPETHNKRTVQSLLPTSGASSMIYRLADGVSDELFEATLSQFKEKGAVPRQALGYELQRLVAGQPERKASTTGRGRRTMEHMAIQVNAIAMGVAELDPYEVAADDMRELIDRAFDDIGVIRSFLRKVNRNG